MSGRFTTNRVKLRFSKKENYQGFTRKTSKPKENEQKLYIII